MPGVSIERTYYCDWRECEAHAKTAAMRLPMDFLSVKWGTARPLHFCSWDCVLRYAAEIEPSEVVE